MSQTQSSGIRPGKTKLSKATQERIKFNVLHFLEVILGQFGDRLPPQYIWRLKGAISLLRGKTPSSRRG